MFLACVGWALAYFGDELAPLVGVTSTSSSSRYVDPVIRTIGWSFLLVVFGVGLYLSAVALGSIAAHA